MFGFDGTVLAFIALAGFSAGAVAYAFLFNRIANEKNVGKRLEHGQEGRDRPHGRQGLARPASPKPPSAANRCRIR